VHYLIPFIPAGALLIGRNVARAEVSAGKISVKIIAGLFLLLGLAALAAPLIDVGGDVGIMEQGDTLFASMGLLTGGFFLLLPIRSVGSAVKRIGISLTLILLFGLIEAKQHFMDDYDMKETAVFIKTKMDQGLPVANIGKYHGQYQFLGRLKKPVAVLQNNPAEIGSFATSHPGALFISYPRKNDSLPERAQVVYTHEYRGRSVVLWQFSNQP